MGFEFFFFKQKTAYEMRISDWSSDVCSSDLDDGDASLAQFADQFPHVAAQFDVDPGGRFVQEEHARFVGERLGDHHAALHAAGQFQYLAVALVPQRQVAQYLLDIGVVRSEEHTSELQSLMRISYAVFCLKKKKKIHY